MIVLTKDSMTKDKKKGGHSTRKRRKITLLPKVERYFRRVCFRRPIEGKIFVEK